MEYDRTVKGLIGRKWRTGREAAGQAAVFLSADTLLLGLGAAFCLAAAWGLDGPLCLSRGCKFHQGFTVLGLSLYLWGAAAFGLGLALKLAGAACYRGFVRICLWGEVLLLLLQVVSAPCSACLLVGLLWGAVAWQVVREPVSQGVWAGLWATALVVLLLELAVPWPLYGNPRAPLKVFFAPGCEACQAELAKLVEAGPEVLERVALYPVARDEAEVAAVWRMVQALEHTGNIWLALAQGTPGVQGLPWLSGLGLRWRLWLNKLMLGRMGITEVPAAVTRSLDMAEDGCSVGQAGCR